MAKDILTNKQASVAAHNLKILFWNARSINRRKEELEEMLREIDIFVCVESWLNDRQKINFTGFSQYRRDRAISR